MEEVGAVVEGYYAAESVHQLSQREGVEMPICRCAYEVLYQGKQVQDVVPGADDPGQKGRAAGDYLDVTGRRPKAVHCKKADRKAAFPESETEGAAHAAPSARLSGRKGPKRNPGPKSGILFVQVRPLW